MDFLFDRIFNEHLMRLDQLEQKRLRKCYSDSDLDRHGQEQERISRAKSDSFSGAPTKFMSGRLVLLKLSEYHMMLS